MSSRKRCSRYGRQSPKLTLTSPIRSIVAAKILRDNGEYFSAHAIELEQFGIGNVARARTLGATAKIDRKASNFGIK